MDGRTKVNDLLEELFRFTQEKDIIGQFHASQLHLDNWNYGYSDPVGYYIPCTELELMSILAHRTTVLPALENNTVAGLIYSVMLCAGFITYLRMSKVQSDVAINHFECERMEEKFWEDARERQTNMGIRELDLTERPQNFHYDVTCVPETDQKHLEIEEKAQVLKEHGMANVPNVVIYSEWVYCLIVFIFCCVALHTVCFFILVYRFGGSASGTTLWLCETSVTMAHHINHKMKNSWLVTGLRSADQCLLDIDAEHSFGRQNVSAMVFDRAYHNLQRLHLHEITPSVSTTASLAAVILSMSVMIVELFSTDTKIAMMTNKYYKGNKIVLSQTHFCTMRNVILLLFLFNSYNLISGTIDRLNEHNDEDCFKEHRSLETTANEAYYILVNNTKGWFYWEENYRTPYYPFSNWVRRPPMEKEEMEDEQEQFSTQETEMHGGGRKMFYTNQKTDPFLSLRSKSFVDRFRMKSDGNGKNYTK